MKNILKNIISVKQLWGGIVPLHIFGAIAIWFLLTDSAPWWWWITTIIGVFFMDVVGIGAGYHRLFSHRGYTVNNSVKRLMLMCGTLAAQGSAILWCGVHRNGHHKFSDTDKDPHSPKHGFWHSYIGWVFTMKEGDVNVRTNTWLLKDADFVFAHKYYNEIIWVVYGCTALINLNLFFYLLILPALITLHLWCLQTSVVHYPSLGYRNTDTNDSSTNIPWLLFITLGECWHNNHHADPRNPLHGGKKWWEFDPTFWLINLVRTDRRTI